MPGYGDEQEAMRDFLHLARRRADAAPDGPQLDLIDRSFLRAVALAERFGFGGTPMRLYNDVVQRGRTDPITEKDFTDEERAAFRRMIIDKWMRTGERQGSIDYPDYRGSGASENSIGGFRYAVDGHGNIVATDKYDFNTNRGHSHDRAYSLRAIASFVNPRGMAAQIGRQVVPPNRGVDVRLNLPPVYGADSTPVDPDRFAQ